MRPLTTALALGSALIALCATPSIAQTPPATPGGSATPTIVFGDVTFKVDKRYADLGDPGPYYPNRAMRNGVSGVAILGCHVGDDLHLNDCKVLAEKPRDLHFGGSSLFMAKSGWMTAKPDAEQPHTMDGWVPIRVVFKAP